VTNRHEEALDKLLDAIRDEVRKVLGRGRPGRRLEIHAAIVIKADGSISDESDVSPARRRPLAEGA
jgi:hypothetical protein